MEKNENDQIQSIVEKCAGKLFQKLRDTKLCIAHFLCGTIDTSGAIRKSSMRTKDSLLSKLGEEWYATKKPSDNKLESIDIKHRDVLRDHIRHLDRPNTFLSVIEKIFTEKMKETKTLNKLVIQIKIDTTLSPHSFDFNKEKLSDRDECLTNTWKCGTGIPGTLIPSEADEYLEHYYLPSPSESKKKVNWHLRFKIARSKTFGRMYEQNERKLPDEEILWENLAALQAAMLYLKQCGNAQDKENLIGTAILIKLGGVKAVTSEPQPIGVVILSPGIENNQIVEVENIVREFLCEATNIVFPCGVIEAGHIKPRFAGNTESETDEQRSGFEERMKKIEIFKLPVQKQRAKLIGLWLLCLTERLQNSVHEGELLDFFFVIGDKSEFQDHPQITFKDFEKSTPQDLKLLAVPKSRMELLKNYEEALKILTKEHYPWFQGGRNALFWDVSGDSFHPLGLVAIMGSSWAYIVADRHYNRQSVDIPNCVTMFTIASTKSAGAIMTGAIMTTGKKDKKVEEIAKLKNSQWNVIVIGDDREKKLKDQLKKRITPGKVDDNTLGEIAKLAILVADNPKTGGIILIGVDKYLFGKDKVNPVFPEMGKAWDFRNISLEDRIALIAHDGATARKMAYKDLVHWKHRLLLIPDGVSPDVKKKMFEYSQNPKKEFPLSCVGSRRWSAAMAAFHPEVAAVIVISQDGDILCWAKKFENTLNGALCLKLPQSGKAQTYVFKDKQWKDI